MFHQNTLQTVDSLLHENIEATYDAFDKDFKDLLEDCTKKEKEIVLYLTIEFQLEKTNFIKN